MRTTLKIQIVLVITMISLKGMAQSLVATSNKKLQYTGVVSIGRSSFICKGYTSPPDYASAEVRIGLGLSKQVGKYFELKSGMYFGLKFKRESYIYGSGNNTYFNEPDLNFSLNKTVSSRNHLVTDIPLVLQFNPPKTKLGLKAGLYGRFWAPYNASVDVLTGRPEVGILGGLSHQLTKRTSLGVELYRGLTRIYSGSYSTTVYSAWNQFAQLSFAYAF